MIGVIVGLLLSKHINRFRNDSGHASKIPPVWSIKTKSGRHISIPSERATNRGKAISILASMSECGDLVDPHTLKSPMRTAENIHASADFHDDSRRPIEGSTQPAPVQFGLTDETVEILRVECTKNKLFGGRDTSFSNRDTVVLITLIGGVVGTCFGQPFSQTKPLFEWLLGTSLIGGLCVGFCCSLFALFLKHSRSGPELKDTIPRKYQNRYGKLPCVNLELLLKLSAYDDAIAKWEQTIEAQNRLKKSCWLDLDGWTFERTVAELLHKKGYEVQVTPGSGDGGIDLIIAHQGKSIIAQCKNHASSIGPAVVRELYGTMISHGAAEAWLIASSRVTIGAKKFTDGKPIRIIDLDEIIQWESEVQNKSASSV